MSIAAVAHRHVFGLKGDVNDNVCYLDEQTILYPAGANTVLYNIDQKTQRFIPGTDRSEGMTAMAVSPNRRYAAIAEKEERATVTIYDLHNLRKRKVLMSPDCKSKEFVSLAFSPDSKYLVTQGAGPDWMLMYWTWEKSKVMAATKSSNATNSPVYQVTFNPQDNTQLCVVGDSIFKLYRYSEGNLKQFAFQKMEPQNYLCQAWVSEDRVMVGTDTSKLLLFETGELKAEFTNTYGAEKRVASVDSIISYSKGFVCAGEGGAVHLYEKSDDKDFYKKTKEFAIDQNPSKILNLAISPSEENLICSTETNQIYALILSNTEILKGDEVNFENLAQSFHHDAITGLDVCVRKPLCSTTGLDRSVRIWNYQDNTLELVKYFQEEAYSIALHPSGLYVLVGFSDKLRLMNLLIDDIRPFKEFTIRGCRECRFSNGGHLFAAVHGNVIQIYSSYTFENVGNLKGHNGKVRSICWTQDDSKIVSCGMDGAVYEWKLQTYRREAENVLKSCSYTSAVVSPDGRTTYTVGTDKTLKEISDSQIIREANAKDAVLTQVAMSRSGRMLFTGTSTGTIRSMKFPLASPGDWQEHQAHSSAVTRMRISFDDQYMFTVAEDACLYVFKITDKEGRGLTRDKEMTWAEEILITKSDLEEKNSMMAELKTRVEELKMENEYQLRLKDMNYNEKIKELTEKFVQEMEALKTQNMLLKSDKDKEEARHEEELAEENEKHGHQMNEIETLNNQKLMAEYEKYQELQSRTLQMQEQWELQTKAMEDSKEQALMELTEYYEGKLRDKINELDSSNNEQRQQFREFEETKHQIEDDVDREVLDLKTKYERKLKEEREASLRLKGENGIMRKKFNSLQKEIEDHKGEIQKMFNEQKKLHSVIKSLEKDIMGLKKKIQERDETIQDKEKRIYDLKKKNQELEKFKFVLDYKIKELKKQIEPRENDIKGMKEQIQEMDRELERYHKQNSTLELSIADLKLKLKASEKEIQTERQKVRDSEAVARRFRNDLSESSKYIQDPKALKECMKTLYQKHMHDTQLQESGVGQDIQREYNRQREYLERCVASLRRKLSKDAEVHRADNVRIMQENVSLIKEINDLRRELKNSRQKAHELDLALNRQGKSFSGSMGTNKMVENAGAGNTTDESPAKMLDIQREEIGRLREKVIQYEHYLQGQHAARASAKLPPVRTGSYDSITPNTGADSPTPYERANIDGAEIVGIPAEDGDE